MGERGMMSYSVKLSGANVAGLGVNSAQLFRRAQMEAIGKECIKAIRRRSALGKGSDDSAFPALSAKYSAIKHNGKFVRQRVPYAQWKAKRGLQPIRDLVGTGKEGGHMLDNLTVRSVTDSTVRMSFTQRKARAKAIANERRTPFLSIDGSVESAVIKMAKQMFGAQIEILRRTMAPPYVGRAAA